MCLETRLETKTKSRDSITSGNTIPHENVYIRKIKLQKMLEITEFNEENFSTTQKAYIFQEKIALAVVVEKNAEKALISIK